MDEITGQLNRIYAAVDHMANLESQDKGLVVDMSQAMLNDLIETGELKPMLAYVGRYCDVADGPEDAERIAADI
jgi:hypothetical protein